MSTPTNTPQAASPPADTPAQLPATDAPVMKKAKTPVSAGGITAVGIVLAVLTAALGCVGVHDAFVSANVATDTAWSEWVINALDGLKPQWWAVPVGAFMVLLGLWLLLVALRPRPRTAVALRSRTGVYMRLRDVKRLAARAADDVDGVVSTHVSATRRAASMTVTVTGDDGRISQDVQDAVSERLAALEAPPRLKIKTKPGVAP